MQVTHPHHPLRIFWLSALLTIALGVWVTLGGGLASLWIFTILVVLEVTFSFDNAVINSKVLARMSRRWQMVFLTVGIFIAVFVVRFALPIVIVMLASNNSFDHVVDMALNHPSEYGEILHHSAPVINAFGGSFLLMIGLSYFVDRNKDIHWLGRLENALSGLGRSNLAKPLIISSVIVLLYLTVAPDYRQTVLIASVSGALLHALLHGMSHYFDSHQPGDTQKLQVGWAAFASFLYLEVLDASFSFDGVIGAFAITTSVLLIIAGLGAGAIWVRSLTIYLLRTGTLTKYKYLEHGAHWAILALGTVMIIKLYGFEPPEWLIGSFGLVFIGTAIISSILEKRLDTSPDRYRGWS